MCDLGVDVSEPTTIHVDNSGAVELSRDRKSCNRSRHVLRRYFYVREAAARGDVVVEKVDTKLNWSDLLTKNTFDVSTFVKLKQRLMNLPAIEAALHLQIINARFSAMRHRPDLFGMRR